MACFKCVNSCPTNGLGINKEVSCIRFEVKPGLRKDVEKCNECNICNEVCPMGAIVSSADDCSFCIICKGRPGCMLPLADRISFFNSINSIGRFIVSRIHFLTI